jgi:hypothetical protein
MPNIDLAYCPGLSNYVSPSFKSVEKIEMNENFLLCHVKLKCNLKSTKIYISFDHFHMFLNHNNSISLQNPFVVYVVFITTNVHVYSLSTFQKSVTLLGNEKNTYSMMHQAIK